MYGRQRSGWRSRPTAAVLTLAAHVAFVLLLLLEARNMPPPPPVVRQPVMIPITLPPLLEPPQRPSDSAESAGDAATPRPRTAPPVVVTPLPSTAITLPPAPAREPGAPTDRDVDWYGQAAVRARRYAEEAEGPPESFSPPPVVLRKPCKPRDESFEFKHEQNRTGGIAALTLGWEKPEPDKHMFDDMMAGRRSPSSVPDPNTCD